MEAGLQRYLRWVRIVAADTFCKTHAPRMGSHTMKAKLGPRPRAPPVVTLPSSRGSADQQGRQASPPPRQRGGVEVRQYSGGVPQTNLNAANGNANLA
jgi:hypothetical protein